MSEFPEALAAAALAALYVSEQHVWEDFVQWCRDEQFLLGGEQMSRAEMRRAYRQLREMIREIEIQLLAAKIGESLKET